MHSTRFVFGTGLVFRTGLELGTEPVHSTRFILGTGIVFNTGLVFGRTAGDEIGALVTVKPPVLVDFF